MSIQLDTPTTSGPPAISFDTVGSSVVVGIVNVSEYQQRDLKTGDLKEWKPGEPMMGKVVTGLVVSAKDCHVKSGDEETPVKPGDLVSFWCEGGKHFTWRDAVKAAGGVNVGDVMQWTRDQDDPPKKAGFNPKKNYSAVIRRPEAKDGDLADRCVDAYHAQKARPALDAATMADAHDDEAPF